MINNKNAGTRANRIMVSTYTAMGDLISSFHIEDNIIKIEWSNDEKLVCVHSNGFISLYDMFGQQISTLTLDQEIRDSKIVDSRVFSNVFGTGIAVLTSTLSFYVYNNINELKMRRLAEVPEMKSMPVCWSVVSCDNDTQLVVALDNKQLVLLKSLDLSYHSVLLFQSEMAETVLMMSVSYDYSRIALLTETGKIFMAKTSDNLSYILNVFNTESRVKPKQLAWCGNDAIASHWAKFILLIEVCKSSSNTSYLKYPTYSTVLMVQEVDCIRIIDNLCQDLIKKVEKVTEDALGIGSCSSGAYLLEANKWFELQSHKVDDYVRLIQEKNEMEVAVKMCLETACHEFNVANQKMLLRAASFGKCFSEHKSSELFVDTCQKLRILNMIRKPSVGMPLTYVQLQALGIPTLIDRLLERRHFLLALKIAAYLKIPPEEGSQQIMLKWAFYKVKQQNINDEQLAEEIVNRLQLHMSMSFAEIANKAIEYGRKNLAIKLLDHELKPTNQVPLLLKLKQYQSALQRAIESGDTNLIYFVVLRFKEIQSSHEFIMGIRKFPIAYALYQKVCFVVVDNFQLIFIHYQYCKQDDPEKLKNIFFQEDDFISEALCYLKQATLINKTDGNWKKKKVSLVSSALDICKKSKNEFLASHCEEHFRLLKYQMKLEDRYPSIQFYNLSLQDTMELLVRNKEYKQCEELKKEFKVSDKRYYHLKLTILGDMAEWQEIEKLSKTKKSPIGYEVCVDC